MRIARCLLTLCFSSFLKSSAPLDSSLCPVTPRRPAALALSPSGDLIGSSATGTGLIINNTSAHLLAADAIAAVGDSAMADAANASFELRHARDDDDGYDDDDGHTGQNSHDLMEDEEGYMGGGESLLSATARPLVALASERGRQFGLAYCAQQAQLCGDELASETNHRFVALRLVLIAWWPLLEGFGCVDFLLSLLLIAQVAKNQKYARTVNHDVCFSPRLCPCRFT
jgi:hypothetical protein